MACGARGPLLLESSVYLPTIAPLPVLMASHCLFYGYYRDILAFISGVEALPPRNSESVVKSTHNWDTLAADWAAAHFVGDALRWYEGLDAATQGSWASLRAGLLAKFDPNEDDSSDDDEYDDFRYL